MTSNAFDGKCSHCRNWVRAHEGFITKVSGKWKTWCREHVPERIQSQVIEAPKRTLTADGHIVMPYEADNLPLLRSIPGAIWNRDGRYWQVSLKMGDRRRLLEVADELKLEVEPSLRDIPKEESALQAELAGLHPYQVDGVDWLSKRLSSNLSSLLADQMGLGKSVQSLKSLAEGSKVIIVCPANVKYNWQNEVKKWRPELKATVLKGMGAWKEPSPGEIIITSYNILPDWLTPPDRPKGMPWKDYSPKLATYREELKTARDSLSDVILIGDEWHTVKNKDAARSKKAQELVLLCKTIIALTGTPLDNRPDDLYGMLLAMNAAFSVFGPWRKYLTLFNATVNRWGGIEWGKPQPIVPELLRKIMLRRLREDVLKDLPPVTYTTMPVEDVSNELREEMDELWQDYEDILSRNELPAFEQFSSVRRKLAEERIPAMLDYVENAEEQEVPLVVFSSHVAPIKTLASRKGWKVITGATSPEERQNIVDAFQSGRLLGIGLTIRAGGIGLNLTHAWKALFVDKDWNPAANSQAAARLIRIGQKSNKIEIVEMVSSHPLDLHINALLCWKIDITDSAVEGGVVPVVPEPFKTVTHQEETEEQFQARMSNLMATSGDSKQKAKNRISELHGRQKGRATRQVLPLTPERSETVKKAFRYMLSVCDGANERDGCGFNKPDAFIAHIVLRTDLETEQEVETAYYMLTRYYRQLHGDYSTLFKE